MGHKYAVIEATLEHVERMAPNMRQADVEEIEASSGLDPYSALRRGFSCSSHAWTGTVDGEPACMFGVVPVSMMGSVGVPWMLGTDLVEQHATAFLRRNKPYVKQMSAAYNHLINYVDDRNVKAIQWLEWLGFTMSEPQQFGYKRMPFRRFEMRTEHV